jgi:hypothetical protein
VQNAASAPIFLVDTTTNNLVTNPGFEVDTSGWAGVTATLTRNTTVGQNYEGVSSNTVNVTTNAGGAQATSFTAAVTPGTYAFSFEAMQGTNTGTLGVTITGGSAPACALASGVTVTTGFQRYTCSFTSTTTNVTAITVTSTLTGTFYLDAVQLMTSANNFNNYDIGNIQLRGVVNAPAVFQSSSNSTTAFQVQNAAGNSILTVDTLGGQIILAVLKVGDVTNGITLDPATGPDYHGTARPTKRISQSPEFLGAVLRGDGGSNTGTMTTSFDATNFHNYYNWTTNQGSNQDFDVATRVAIPNDFSSLTLTPQICIYGWSDDLTNGTITLNANDSSNAAITLGSSSYTPGSASTWAETCRTISGTPTLTAGGFITLRVTLQAANTKNTRLGEFRIDYLSKF